MIDDIITEDEKQSFYFLYSEVKDYIEYSPDWAEQEFPCESPGEPKLKEDVSQYIKDCFDEYIKLARHIQNKLEEYDHEHGYIRPKR